MLAFIFDMEMGASMICLRPHPYLCLLELKDKKFNETVSTPTTVHQVDVRKGVLQFHYIGIGNQLRCLGFIHLFLCPSGVDSWCERLQAEGSLGTSLTIVQLRYYTEASGACPTFIRELSFIQERLPPV